MEYFGIVLCLRTSTLFIPTCYLVSDYLQSRQDYIPPTPRRIAVGQLYVARSESSKSSRKFYRVEVTDIRGENSFLTRFIDYGISEVKKREELFVVPDRISRHPPAVVALRPAGRVERREVEGGVLGRPLTAVLRPGLSDTLTHFFVDGREILLGGKTVAGLSPPRYPDVPEVLREAVTVPDLLLGDDLEMVDRRRVEDTSLPSPLRPVQELVVTKPKLVLKGKPVRPDPAPQLLTSPGRNNLNSWAIGDLVSAFWCGDNTWKKGVIHELDATSALVVFTEKDVRPTFVDLSLIKPDSVPPAALNLLDKEVSNISRDLSLHLHSGGGQIQEEKDVSSIMSPGLVFDISAADFCRFARTGAGSKLLQTYVTPTNRKLCRKMVEHLLSSDLGVVRMMTNAKSCFLFKKIFENLYVIPVDQRDKLTSFVLENFSTLSIDQFGYHVVLVAITKLEGSSAAAEYVKMLENKSLLFKLVKDPHGTFVAQAMCPALPASTVIFMVNTLLGHVVELSNHQHASYFMQSFLEHWAQSPSLDFVVENILKHQRDLMHHPLGVRTVQKLLKVRPDLQTVSSVTDWVVLNIEAVYKDRSAVFAAKQLISTISAKIQYSRDKSWVQLLDRLVGKLIGGTNSTARSHFLSAACSTTGSPLVTKLLKVSHYLSDNVQTKMSEMISSCRTSLAADNIGCSLLRSVKNLK